MINWEKAKKLQNKRKQEFHTKYHTAAEQIFPLNIFVVCVFVWAHLKEICIKGGVFKLCFTPSRNIS